MIKRKTKKWLLGVGFDHKDGHKRMTKSENFLLVGGSKETHEEMREKVIKLNEELKKRGKDLDHVNLKEFQDIAHALKLYPIKKRLPK